MSKKPFLCHFIDDVKELPKQESTDIKRFLIEKLKIFPPQESFCNKQVLILTRKIDPEVDLIGIKLLQRGIDYCRLNIEDIPREIRIRYTIPHDADSKMEISVRGGIINSSKIPVVLLREFDLRSINFNDNDLSNTFSFQQWEDAYRSLRNNLKCEWINNPGSTIQASDRLKQLSIAKAVGFNIPSTLITNDPITARNFYYAHHGNIVLKTIHHHSIEIKKKIYYIYSHAAQKQDLSAFNDLVYAPCILQQRLDKKSDLRVTVIGKRVFAVELDSLSTVEGGHDINRCQMCNISKKAINLDNKTREKCIKLINSLGLKYGAIDFVIDKNADLFFLEVNPTGDWLWIEENADMQITDAMVDLIEGYYRAL
ncbi:MAG: hypothetical protein WBQ25_00625 [Nitrososphaeraceae archaeon]